MQGFKQQFEIIKLFFEYFKVIGQNVLSKVNQSFCYPNLKYYFLKKVLLDEAQKDQDTLFENQMTDDVFNYSINLANAFMNANDRENILYKEYDFSNINQSSIS